jgi:hypothetical protein
MEIVMEIIRVLAFIAIISLAANALLNSDDNSEF